MYSLHLFTIAIQFYVNPLITICEVISIVSSRVIHSVIGVLSTAACSPVLLFRVLSQSHMCQCLHSLSL